MTPSEIGYLSVVALLAVILLGCPVGIAMAGVGFAGFAAIVGIDPALRVIETAAFDTANRYTFTLIPLFLLMGNLVSQSGMAGDLFTGSRRLMRGWNGSLAAAGMTASAAFSTVSGSSLATASTMTRIAWPEMKARGYDPRLAAGSLAAGGTLGIMIPPSIALLLYALITEQSVGDMFMAGLLPGLLAYALYMAAIAVTARFWRPAQEEAAQDEGGLGAALLLFVPALGLFGIVIGGLYGGVFTPTEAGGAGAGLALLYALFRGMGLDGLMEALRATIRTSATIFIILIGAEIFGFVLSTSQVSFQIAQGLEASGLAPWQVLALILVFYVVMGCFIESLAMILLTVPIFYPVILANGFDPIWFGVIAVVTVELGLITPPVGMNLFMVKTVAPELGLSTIYRGIFPFVLADILRLIVLIAFPIIALFLPGQF